MTNKALSLFLIFLILATLTTTASAGKEIKLTFWERLTERTSIYGNHVFWTETTANALHTLALDTGQRLDRDGHYVMSGQINSYGNKVVWTSGDDAVYMYDISTDNETQIKSGGCFADIYENYVVYTNSYSDGEDHQNDGIYLYNLNSHKEIKIANVYSFPAIYDMKVVWSQANSNNGYEIREFDISTNQTSTITTTNGSILENDLDIYGNAIVWREAGDIYMYDTASHKKTKVTNNGNAFQPAIYGNRIVYTLGDPSVGGNTEIYMYEISTASTTRITNSSSAFSPSIYGDKIVYADWRVYPETEEIRDVYLYDLNPEAEKLKANFITDVSSGDAPLNVSFNDISQGVPKTWYWDFGDGKSSTQQNPTHTYLSAGNYTAHLKVSDANGTDSTMSATLKVLKPLSIIANFSTNVSKGYAPLTVQFTDLSENAQYWYWEFGDNTFDNIASFQQNPTHTFYSAGNYTVNLTITHLYYTNRTSATISVLDQLTSPLPIANFSTNPMSGYAPLIVEFTDASQNATEWNWDFGDGTNSTERSPIHTFDGVGTYNVNLTVSNPNGINSKTIVITVEDARSCCGPNDDDNSGGGSRGAAGSPEPQSNVEVKELAQTFIASGQNAKFDFQQKVTPVLSIGFDSKKTAGKTTATIEMLKNKSSLSSETPIGEVYKYLNIWIGSSGFGTSKNIENSVVNFKVEKSWISDKKIDQSSINLNRYSDSKWDQLSTNLSSEDDKYLYFTAHTPGFSPFAITGKVTATGTVQPAEGKTQIANVNVTQTETKKKNTTASTEKKPEQTPGPNTSGKGSTKAPGFETLFVMVSLFVVFLHKRK